jgi:DNA replication licensing factor MCM7
VHASPSRDDDESDDDAMLLPTANDAFAARRVPAYPPHLQRIRQRRYYDKARTFLVEVPLQELVAWDELKGGALAENAANNTIRYTKLFAQVLDEILLHLSDDNAPSSDVREASWDLLNRQRVAQQAAAAAAAEQRADGADPVQNPFVGGGNLQDEGGGPTANHNANNPSNATMDIPPIVLRNYELRILPLGRPGRLPPFDKQVHGKDDPPAPKAFSLRQIRAPLLGHLVTVKGMVVRAADVKPCTVVATYACDRCGAEVYQPLDGQREFLPVRACPSPTCQAGGRQESLQLQTRTSKFIKFQEVKLQELPNQVPMGHVPRSLTLYCRGEWTRQVTAGDVVTMDGIFLPQKVGQGFRAMKAGLIATTYLEVQNMVLHKKSYDDADESLTPADRLALDVDIHEVTQSTDPIGRLARSIAPEIFGHEDIKRALLLQLVGGCARRLPDGMKIRGDINLCLMGDPGVAKSQLLKHVASIAPRGVYTTGKGSSGVGLTAAVTKDTSTGEMSLEGGALVLADRGICCIDEL